MIKTFYNPENEEKKSRLDLALKELLPDLSRSYIAKAINDGRVTLEQKVATKASLKIFKGELTITPATEIETKLYPKQVDFQVIDENENFAIIIKPAGLLVHPATTASDEITLAHGILHRFQELKGISGDRPGIIHRLDRDTSGIMIVTKTPEASLEFSRLFKERKIKKNYLAIVTGKAAKSIKIDFPIGRHPVVMQKMCANGLSSKPAETRATLLKTNGTMSLLDVQILTGRTHQIRVHMNHIGHHIIGDTLYGKASELINRQALHAHTISFEFQKSHFEYKAEPPNDFLEAAKQI
jgi:23S rRNA pseudouridine1911/1915/1917 synthase